MPTVNVLVPSSGHASFQDWLNRCPLVLQEPYAELLRRKALVFETSADPGFVADPGQHEFGFHSYDLPGLCPNARAVLLWLRDHGVSGFVSAYVNARMLDEGVKVYRPSARECEALEHIDLRIPCESYQQPFATFALEFPEDYSRNRVAPGVTMENSPTAIRPLAVVGHLDPVRRCLLLQTVGQNGLALTTILSLPQGVELEQRLDVLRGVRHDNAPLTEEETELRTRTVRIFANACLLLVDFGCKRVNPPSSRSQRRAERNGGVDPRGVAVYGFDQHVRLFAEAREPTEAPGGGGWTVGPHWRRGHRRRERGYREIEARGETPRRIFIPPVLVNAHLLVGPKANTRVRIEKEEPPPAPPPG